MIQVSTYEAKSRWSELLRLVEQQHERIVVCRHGRPIAEISACADRPDPFAQLPALSGLVAMGDVDAPLTPAGWPLGTP